AELELDLLARCERHGGVQGGDEGGLEVPALLEHQIERQAGEEVAGDHDAGDAQGRRPLDGAAQRDLDRCELDRLAERDDGGRREGRGGRAAPPGGGGGGWLALPGHDCSYSGRRGLEVVAVGRVLREVEEL